MKIHLLLTLLLSTTVSCILAQDRLAILILEFNHVANGRKLNLNDSIFYNTSKEQYQINKLKYYVSHISLKGGSHFIDPQPHLVEDGKNQVIRLKVSPGNYDSIEFMLGLDSSLHCSGAQSGDLDPLHDMFWTWNTGYVIFKLEGKYITAEGSKGKLEHHLGGYREGHQLNKVIDFKLSETMQLNEGDSSVISLKLDLDKYWSGKEIISPVKEPLITKPGRNAVRIAENFNGMFFINDKP